MSQLYHQLLSKPNSPLPTYTSCWERDLEITSEHITWPEVWAANKSLVQTIVALEAKYKVLTYWCLVPARLDKCIPKLFAQVLSWLQRNRFLPPFLVDLPHSIIQNHLYSKSYRATSRSPLEYIRPHSLTQVEHKLFIHMTTATKQTIVRA